MKDAGRAEYYSVTDAQALEAFDGFQIGGDYSGFGNCSRDRLFRVLPSSSRAIRALCLTVRDGRQRREHCGEGFEYLVGGDIRPGNGSVRELVTINWCQLKTKILFLSRLYRSLAPPLAPLNKGGTRSGLSSPLAGARGDGRAVSSDGILILLLALS